MESVMEQVVANEEQKTYVQGLREVADFLEAHPELTKLPFDFTFGIYRASKEEIIKGAKAFGTAEKVYGEDTFQLKKVFPSGSSLYYYTGRETVCERIVVGKKVIPAVTIPAKAEQVMPEMEVDNVEWRCHSLLGGL